MMTVMPLLDTSGEREQAAKFTHSVLIFPPAERTVMRSLVKIEHGKNTGHLVKVVFSFAEAFIQFNTVQN